MRVGPRTAVNSVAMSMYKDSPLMSERGMRVHSMAKSTVNPIAKTV
jgi:hypothetical protein